jgi:ectoine hydroxylase-related dioxygenase (phytanoyl-CoA dioxygenase family)
MTMSVVQEPLPAPTEVGTLGVFQLKRAWARKLAERNGRPVSADRMDPHYDHLVFDAIGLGLEQTIEHLGQNAPSFDEFERWIVATTGGVERRQVARINAAISGRDYPDDIRDWLAGVESGAPVLSPDDLAFWDEHGYVVLHDAVAAESRDDAVRAIHDHLGSRPDDPQSWYRQRSIMVQLFQHPAFAANRRAPRVHKAFAQLWGTADLWVTTDRVGFNAPLRTGWSFHAPGLHWDTSLHQPMERDIQGILYLTDTAAEQGAFTCVPGFHRVIAAWLESLPPGADPRQQDLHALGAEPIAGRAGDLIIWHAALPHGASPNRGTRPRIVQYIKMYPTRLEPPELWT